MNSHALVQLACALFLAPLMLGVINRTKAFFAGRQGPPLAQPYFDLGRLMRKGVVYSRTTSWVFRLAPPLGLAVLVSATVLMPVGAEPALWSFSGDVILFIYLFGVLRFLTVVAALDTGSSFEGMGASREVYFSAMAEPAVLMALATLALLGGSGSMSAFFGGLAEVSWWAHAPALLLVAAVLLIVLLVENSRIPFDDPNTHLELTMIHEVMILDYSGPDLAFILYGAALKLWLLGGLIVNLALGAFGLSGPVAFGSFVLGQLALAVVVGVVESVMARLDLLKVAQLLIGAGAVAALALMLVLRAG